MIMQKSGLNKDVVYLFIVPAILLVLLIYIFTFSGVSSHDKKLVILEQEFKTIEHPAGTERIEYQTHLGEGPYVSGDGPDECHYYVGEIRSFSGSFDDIEQHYSSFNLNEEFADGWIDVVEISVDNKRIKFVDMPIDLWTEDYLNQSSLMTYVVFIRFSDKIDSFGDYRCWRD